MNNQTTGSMQNTAATARHENDSVMEISHQNQIEVKLKEIEANQQKELENSVHVKSFAQINEKLYDYHAYFLMKPQDQLFKPIIDLPPQPLNHQHSKKNPLTKHQNKKISIEKPTNVQMNHEDYLDFNWVYVEVTDRERQRFTCLLSAKLLVHVLTGNPYESQANIALITSKDPLQKDKVVDYIKTRTKINEMQGTMKIEAF